MKKLENNQISVLVIMGLCLVCAVGGVLIGATWF